MSNVQVRASATKAFDEKHPNNMLSDNELVTRLQQGHVEAFDVLYHRHFAKIKNFVKHRRSSLNQDDCEEVAQNTFVAAFRHIDKFRQDCEFTTWLCKIASNQAYNFINNRIHKPDSGAIPLSEGEEGGCLTEEYASRCALETDQSCVVRHSPDPEHQANVCHALNAIFKFCSYHEKAGTRIGRGFSNIMEYEFGDEDVDTSANSYKKPVWVMREAIREKFADVIPA